jgi:hypothetical protein
MSSTLRLLITNQTFFQLPVASSDLRGGVVQLVRTPAFHAGGRELESVAAATNIRSTLGRVRELLSTADPRPGYIDIHRHLTALLETTLVEKTLASHNAPIR